MDAGWTGRIGEPWNVGPATLETCEENDKRAIVKTEVRAILVPQDPSCLLKLGPATATPFAAASAR